MAEVTENQGNSVLVRQIFEIMVGRIPVHNPKNEFRTVQVVTIPHYCGKCFSGGTWDVWEGVHDGLEFRLGRCRVCGHEETL